jgi:hypothetical protein
MNTGSGRLAVITAVLFTWLPGAACAEPLETTVGLTVNALSGQHQTGNGQADRLSFAPLPLAEVTLRHGTESVRVEGLPPLTVGYFNQNFGGSSTRLSILNATYRHALRGGWFAGIGETVYNQDTSFAAHPTCTSSAVPRSRPSTVPCASTHASSACASKPDNG